MNKLYNKFLIVFSIIILFLGVYMYFFNDLSVQASTQPPQDSSLVSSQGSPTSAIDSSNKIAQDTSFLDTLTALTRIQISTSIFIDPIFNSLNDNTVSIDPVTPGRQNPFAPIDSNASVSGTTTSQVETDQPTQITTKSAMLNGIVNNSVVGANTYFEYGTTDQLGKTTPVAKPSLVGTFVYNVLSLQSKTQYFFRSVAKINGTIYYGNIVSFNTN